MNEGRADAFVGRAWVLTNEHGRLIDNVDTDQIYHNAHLAVTELADMAKYALGNLSGWEDFPTRARKGDLLIAGENFGAGSSRQHAVDCFIALGIGAVVARSFAPIYRRNAINSGLPILACPALESNSVPSEKLVELDFRRGMIRDATTKKRLVACSPPSGVQIEVYEAGGLFSYGSKLEGTANP